MRVYSVRRITSSLGLIVLGVIFIAVGVFFGVVLSNKVAETQARCTASTEGTVTSVTETEDEDGNTEYEFTVDYEVGGKKHQKQSKTSRYMNYGDKFTVKYDPDDPDTSYIEGYNADPKMTRIMGGVLGAAGLIAIITGIGRKKKGY